ncbi:calcium-translocating P-type ATPase, PMCA-type [Alkaliphilus oremlandii]|uniref:P-type Ca(2+) transporter n=1 Tax=Alkaliphilus oremlandii (strain OhILAs) TaxID=350688 RepID=A8MIF7_ALKOO|nr:calcium-translocating P-type ATPase, PMCA-type [Alkaliphilus oremlandii]ABW19589.1 calcium-translocating P-type ATPase, PMCA-type [Alkaliphilus oremlandii OhILAs]
MENHFKGLSQSEVEQSRQKNGTNALTQLETETFWQKFIGNFDDPIIKILIFALVINVIFVFMGKAHWYEAVGIAAAVLLATLVSTWSEHSNENAFQKLQEDASKIKVKVFRNGKIEEILIDDIVVGDLVVLQSGDMIPADGKLIDGEMRVDQATLNGESKEAKKFVMPSDYVETEEEKKKSFFNEYKLFRGTVVVSGQGVMEVLTVGDNTHYGQLAQEMQTGERESPLTVKLEKLAGQISKFGYIGGGLITIAYFFQQAVIENNFNMAQIAAYFSNWSTPLNDLVTAVILGVIIIVVAVPEGLPMMIAMVLSLNMRKMLKDNVLVRKLVGIETAGGLNILFSDKTGTITKGQLEVVEFITGNIKRFNSYNSIDSNLKKIVHLSITENTNALVSEEIDEKGHHKIIGGNGTERAVLGFIDHKNESAKHGVNRVKTMPFSSDKKYSATQVKGEYNLTLIKGAPERMIAKCNSYYDENGNKQAFNNHAELENLMDEMAARAIRLLAIATTEEDLNEDGEFNNLTLVGILAIRDDVRAEATQAIKEVQEAGIQVVMITGDRRETAISIAKDAGLLTEESHLVLTSDELQKLSDEELKKMLPNIRVIARALPTDKSRLVRLSQELNLVVGMTGDGVNDSPALKQADVGFAMGSGTEVAKEAGDIVILDDNFQSIAKAVLYGRTIFKSIRKFIIFQLTINVSAVLISFIGPFIGIHEALTITQMLWINLVMDTLAAIAFGGEPALKRYMKEKPMRRDENILSSQMKSAIGVGAIYTAVVSILFLTWKTIGNMFIDGSQGLHHMTAFFSLFVLIAVFNGFNARSSNKNIFEHIGQNPNFLKVMGLIVVVQILMTYIGGVILRTTPLDFNEWLMVLLLSASIIPIDLIRKFLVKSDEA